MDRVRQLSPLIVSLVVLLTLLLIPTACQAELRKEPYLIYPGQASEMWIRWQATSSATYTFEWGATADYEAGKLSSRPDPDRYHMVRLDGLTPSATYHYRVTGGGDAFVGVFRTALSSASSNVTFYGLADTQYTTNCWRTFEAIEAHIGSRPPASTFTLLAGDWVQTTGPRDMDFMLLNELDHNRVVGASQPLSSSAPLLGCLGNHDVDHPRYRANFEQCWPYPTVGSMYWSFDFGPIHVVVVDQYTDLSEGSAQLDWLLEDLGEVQHRPWTIVLQHDPWHPQTAALWSQFRDYGVDLVLAGHNHSHSYDVFDEVPQLVMTAASKCGNSSCDYVHRMFYEFDVRGSEMTLRAFDLGGALEWEETIAAREGTDRPEEPIASPASPASEPPVEPETPSKDAPGEEDPGVDNPGVEAPDENPKSAVSLDLDVIDWVASINCDENPNTPGNDAWIVEGSSDFGPYQGMAWESPEVPDLSLNDLDRFDWDGVRTISLTLAANAPMEVDAWVSVAGDYCGRHWRYAAIDLPFPVTTEPREFVVDASDFLEDPEGHCNEPLDEAALEGTYSIILFPQVLSGELRVYRVEVAPSVDSLLD